MAEAPELVEEPYLYINICNWTRMLSRNRIIHYIIRSIARNDPHFTIPSVLTRRSYSEFDELRQLLVSRHGDVQVPNIPPRVPADEFCQDVIQSSVTGLQQFIDQVLAIEELRRDPCLAMFMQSLRPVAEIREFLEQFRPRAEIREEVEANAQQEELNPNRQAHERANRDNPEAEDPIADDDMDDRRPAGYIFDMDDID